jgi:hypothetical protein
LSECEGTPQRWDNELPRKIISGGQTGADRGALDFTIAHGIEHGGTSPLSLANDPGASNANIRGSELCILIFDFEFTHAKNVLHDSANHVRLSQLLWN